MKPIECYPHGGRSCYLAGCRCTDCRAANTAYRRKQRAAHRLGECDQMVSTEKTMRHLRALSLRGVGRQAVSDASSVALCVIEQIKRGAKTRIRTSTERRILAVTEAALMDGARLPADKTKALIRDMREEGYTVRYLAQRLGYQKRSLSIGRGRFVTLRNADRIERLHRALTGDALIAASFGRPRNQLKEAA